MNRPLLRLGRHALVLSAPLICLVLTYLVLDPFKTVRSHENYYTDWRMPPNREHVSAELLLRRRPGHFDSFILGNSRTLAFLSQDWVQHLTPESRPFHFDASGESLYGLWTKLRFLDRRGDRIRHALILIDDSVLTNVTNSVGVPFIKDYRISGQGFAAFQLAFAREFYVRQFLWTYLQYRITGHVDDKMLGYFSTRTFEHVPETNDLIFASNEREIRELGERYFADPRRFPPRTAAVTPSASVGEIQRTMLVEMADILKSQSADFVVVVPPVYEQIPIGVRDRQALDDIFGADRVHDYSGRNVLTEDVHNYYESSHFRPTVARRIMADVYAPHRSGGESGRLGP